MSLCCWLILLVLISTTTGKNPGVKVRLTEKGLEYGKSCCRPWPPFKVPQISPHPNSSGFVRQTTGHGLHRAETQKHQNPRHVRKTEGVSHWQSLLQFVKVRRLYIQIWEILMVKMTRIFFFNQAFSLLQYQNGECETATVSSDSCSWDWRQTVHW